MRKEFDVSSQFWDLVKEKWIYTINKVFPRYFQIKNCIKQWLLALVNEPLFLKKEEQHLFRKPKETDNAFGIGAPDQS